MNCKRICKALMVSVLSLGSAIGQEQPSAEQLEARDVSIRMLGELYGELIALNEILLADAQLIADKKTSGSFKNLHARKKRTYDTRFSELMELATEVAETDLARDAAILTLKTTYGRERKLAIDILLDNHITSSRMDEVVRCLSFTSRSNRICERILAVNFEPSVQGHANYQIASMSWADSDEAREAAKQVLWNLVKNAANIPFQEGARWGPNPVKRNLAQMAFRLLQRIRGGESVVIGQKITKIQGVDMNGEPIGFAEYEGRATLIVFWATWCGPCLKMAEIENRLLDHYNGKPFEILGVCGDDVIDKQVRDTALKHKISWRSIQNVLPDGTRLSTRLGASAWPYCILLDQEGIVRRTEFPTGVTNDPESQFASFQACIDQVLNRDAP